MKMKYYKLSMNMERENDIVCHYKNDYGIRQNALNTGRFFEDWDDRFEFFLCERRRRCLDRLSCK